MSLLEREAVRRVRDALRTAGCDSEIVALETTARSARDAAVSIGCELGQIVKSLIFAVDGQPVLALVAGDRRCRQDRLPEILGLAGEVGRADADLVRERTGFSIGGVPPLGHRQPLPTAVDASLQRFPVVHAAAGHPHCVFPVAPATLIAITDGVVSEHLAEPAHE